MDAVASGFAHLSMDAVRAGVLRGYVSRDEAR